MILIDVVPVSSLLQLNRPVHRTPEAKARKDRRSILSRILSGPSTHRKQSNYIFADPFQGSMAGQSLSLPSSVDTIAEDNVDDKPPPKSTPLEIPFSEDDSTPPTSIHSAIGSRTGSSSSNGEHGLTRTTSLRATAWQSSLFRPEPQLRSETGHVIRLSSIEHCMPRAYIRVCLSFPVVSSEALDQALLGLNDFVRKLVDAKPYLAGYVVHSRNSDRIHVGEVEIRFTNEDFLNYPDVQQTRLKQRDGKPVRYVDLDRAGLPPSRLRPEEVARLPTDVADDQTAPVFRAQANIVEGGLIVSFYLHHCISDGRGLGLLVHGDVLKDDFAFQRHLDSKGHSMPPLEERLSAFAHQKSVQRQQLSWSSPNQINTRHIRAKRLDVPAPRGNPPGRGCIIFVPRHKLEPLMSKSSEIYPGKRMTHQSVLMSLLWRHMSRARRPSICHNKNVTTSKLLIPVDIREKIIPNLPDSYFGAAVDFAKAELDFETLFQDNESNFARVAATVRDAIEAVDEDYIRQAIALARSKDHKLDVRDLQASNMDRVAGADMYITSWLKIPLYKADLGMGLGTPDWVRKPWSRDPGSCIILPGRGKEPEHFEVVVQMTEIDMARLLEDKTFMEFVDRIID